MGTDTAMDALAARQQELTTILSERPEMSMVEIQKIMGISRSWLYQLRDWLVELGILYPAEDLRNPVLWPEYPAGRDIRYAHPVESMATPHHGAIRHSWWTDASGDWAVQSALLDRWDRRSYPDALPDERVIVVRLAGREYTPREDELPPAAHYWSWVTNRRWRCTAAKVNRQFFPGQLTAPQLDRLTREVAWSLDTDAVVPPVERSAAEILIEDGPRA
jgi:hypothetical protein